MTDQINNVNPKKPEMFQIINAQIEELLKEGCIAPFVMPFGLHSVPATSERPDRQPYAFTYLDDIIVFGTSLEEYVYCLLKVFRMLTAANLRLYRKICHSFQRKFVYLVHVVSEMEIHTHPGKVTAVRMIVWYRRFAQNFATVLLPMSLLLRKGRHWKWGTNGRKFALQPDVSDFVERGVLT